MDKQVRKACGLALIQRHDRFKGIAGFRVCQGLGIRELLDGAGVVNVNKCSKLLLLLNMKGWFDQQVLLLKAVKRHSKGKFSFFCCRTGCWHHD